jgi:protein ImuA
MPGAPAPPWTLGVPEIDRILPGGGLARGALHEVLGAHDRALNGQARHGGGAALAFTAVLAARRAAAIENASPQDSPGGGQVLWCPARPGLYGPGLAAFGLGPGQLILVHARDDQQRLWAMEEGLKCTGLAMVVGEVGRLDLGQSRRLQLAAEASGVTALLLPRKPAPGPGGDSPGLSAGLTRWRITTLPSAPTQGYAGIGAPRCRVELLRCKGGRPGEWLLQWNGDGFSRCDAAGAFAAGDKQHGHEYGHEHGHEDDGERPETNPLPVAAAMADGPAVPHLAARP